MIELPFLGLLALVPVAVILYVVYKKDHDPEPFRTLKNTFLWGCLTVVSAFILETLLVSDNPIVENFLVIAPAEEIGKMAVIMLYIWKHKDFDDSFDAIVYSVMASLGFAAVENLAYVLGNGWSVGIARAVFSIPGHASFAIFMGYFIGKAKTHFYYYRNSKMFTCLALALCSAIFVHGMYDFLLSLGSELFMLFLVYVVVMDAVAIKMVLVTSKDDHPMIQDFDNNNSLL